ncbi:TOM1-like protein 2 [Olea europaea var. sylvestris]|uniref:TOM1 2 n=1 Tax=Olea europaea subsp. europaea TaxID=158383 RepID=A0A8S0V389_OLEEU|nr:TOM1-like protein 2 [Olea europaea var. sylvestris]CAA3024914.1 TOM1 2 [Olea europaea subsp. europaea]
MEKLDLSKLKLASSSLGERIKTSGAQMGRTISTKMKEILQSPTPESKIVDEATAESMEEPNWSLNLRICSMVNKEELNGTEIVKAIKKKLVAGKSPVSQMLSLDLLETCTSNCEKMFSEVASEKVLDDMLRLIDDPKAEQGNKVKAMQLIRAWGESEDLMYLPVFHQTYLNLKTRGTPPVTQDGNAPPTQYSLESYLDRQPRSPPGSYPIPNTSLQNVPDAAFISYSIQSVEEKKEFLEITRNTLDILSSILNSEVVSESLKDDLTVSMLEKCRHSLPVLQGIIESTSDDDLMLFEALNLNDEIQKVISKYEEMVASLEPEQPNSDAREELPIHSDDNARELPYHADAKGATLALQNESQRETESLNSLEVGISGSRSETNNKSAQAQKAIPE